MAATQQITDHGEFCTVVLNFAPATFGLIASPTSTTPLSPNLGHEALRQATIAIELRSKSGLSEGAHQFVS